MSPAASTRWCPTPEQVMILEEMYRSGVRTPNAAQIQQITAHLSLYGKIEGKNVFYWFQNHKARDRQKLRKKLLGKQLQQQQQQHQQQMMFSHHHHVFPTFDPHHFQHLPPHQNNLLHPIHFDHQPPHLPPPPPPLPLPLPPPCCGSTPSSSFASFHHHIPSVNPSPCFAAHQTRAEDVPQLANTRTWNKMESSSSEPKYGRGNTKQMMRMITNDDHDDWMMMMRSGQHHHHHHHQYQQQQQHHDNHNNHDDDDGNSSTRPIKTLELFPIKDKTSLKDDLSYV